MPPAPPRATTDEIDPELVSLRRRVPVGPILVASVLGFALLMMVRLRHDLSYAREPEKPADLGRIRDHAPPLPDNAHVSFTGEVDAWMPARLRGTQTTGRRLAPVLGTSGAVWLDEAGEAIDEKPPYDGRFSGRLRRLDDAAFATELREFVAKLPPRPRFVYPEALTTGQLPAVDVHGEPLTVAPDTAVTVEERVPDVAIVTMVRTDTIADEAAAVKALQDLGLVFTPVPVEKTDASWTFQVNATPDAAAAKLRDGRLFGAAAEAKIVEHTGRVAELQVTSDGVVIAGHPVGRAAIDHLEILVPMTIPAEAWVLLTGDTPARLWYMPPLYGGLAVISLLMGWALAVAIRHMRKQRADSAV